MESSTFITSMFFTNREREIHIRECECNAARYGVSSPGIILTSQDYE